MEVNEISSWEEALSVGDKPVAQAPQIQDEVKTESLSENSEESAINAVTENEDLKTDEQSEQVHDEVPEQAYEKQSEEPGQYESQSEENYDNTGEVASLQDLDEDALYQYLSLKKTDYNQVNDIDIIAGFISSDHPNWDSDDIEFELEQKYGSALFEEKIDLEEIDKEVYPDEYKDAVKFNKEIDRAQKLLKRDALEKRSELEELKQNIQLPTSGKQQKPDNNVTETSAEEKESGLSEEQVQYLQQQWIDSVERDVPSVSEFKFKLGDEDVSYKVTEDEQRDMVQKMKQFNAENYLVERGWVNTDGTPNVKKITEDVYILENSEKMFKSGWTQAKEKAKMDIIGKDIKNINLGSGQTSFDAKGGNPHDFGDYVLSL